MVRNTKNPEEITISVFLKNGDKFERKDITDKPMGETERVISFWDGDDVVVIPIEQVERYVFHTCVAKG